MLGAGYKDNFWDQILAGLIYQAKEIDGFREVEKHFRIIVLVIVIEDTERN